MATKKRRPPVKRLPLKRGKSRNYDLTSEDLNHLGLLFQSERQDANFSRDTVAENADTQFYVVRSIEGGDKSLWKVEDLKALRGMADVFGYDLKLVLKKTRSHPLDIGTIHDSQVRNLQKARAEIERKKSKTKRRRRRAA